MRESKVAGPGQGPALGHVIRIVSVRVAIVGAGIFGVTAALELRRRRHDVTLLDAGEIPHPLAESTDVSKAVRMDYGADDFYTSEMERALEGWRAWNAMFGEELFHETGTMFVTREAFIAAGGFPEIALMEDIEFARRLKRISRPLCLRARVITSGRRWESRGVLRTIVLMWRLRLAYFFSAKPEELRRRYES